MLISTYRADSLLGDGALGKLYEAEDSRTRQRVAIRVVRGKTDAKVLAQLQSHARALDRLRHAAIVSILECGRLPEGPIFLVSPLVKGHSLEDQFLRLAGQPWPLALQFGQQIASLLASVHQSGILHLALRPSQILISAPDLLGVGPVFRLLGLGVAQALGRTWVSAEGLPQPPFAAPEQHADSAGTFSPVDDRGDVFALGVILWRALTGSSPFPNSGPHRGGAPTFAVHGEPPPDGVIELLGGMVATNPAERPSMRRVADFLSSLGARSSESAEDADTNVFPRQKPEVQLAPTNAALAPTDLGPQVPVQTQLPASIVAPEPSIIEEPSVVAEQPPDTGSVLVDPHAGRRFGNFETVRKIGEGGMGIVYEARHRKIGRRAAIKIMHKELAQNADYAARFLNEARAVNIIQHRGLVEISEYGKLKDGTLFIVMEYLQGQSLRERITKNKKFPEQEVAHLALQIARALTAAHAKGIIHRDLKPENIMLVPDPVTPEQDWVKILDFGIAKVDPKARQTLVHTPNQQTHVGAIMGTPDYMAPEQFGRAEEADGRADVFSLGVVLYELLAGEPPYTGTPLQLVSKSFRPLSVVNPAVTLRMTTLVERMLSVSADSRPTMEQVAKELSAMRPSSVLIRMPLARPRLLLGAATIAVFLAGLAIFFLTRSPSRPTLAEAKVHAITVLEANLRNDNPLLQLSAIKALAKSGDLNQRSLLEPLLQDRRPQVIEEAVRALGQIGAVGARYALLELLKHPHSASLDVIVADALAHFKDPEGVKMLTEALEKEDPQIKLRAATLLLDHGSLAGAPALWERIARANLSEQASLVTIGQLAQAGEVRARKLLEDTLQGTDKIPARLFAAWSLSKLGDNRGRVVLTEAAEQPGPGRLLANQLLAAIGEPIGSSFLIEIARSSKEPDDNRELAIAGLADCGLEDAVFILDGLLKQRSTSEAIRIAAAGAMLRLIAGERTQLAEQSLSWAKAAMDSDSAITRELAAASLGEISSDQTIPPLGQALRDRQREVRRTAARALGTKSARAALDALASSLDDQDIEVRAAGMRAISSVVSSLRKQGDKDADRLALTRLKRMARDGSEQDRVAASGILMQLGDTEQQGRLRAALSSRDPLTRKLAVELSDADQRLFERALKDSDRAVRLVAARRLADQGSHLGVTVLREAVQEGELDGLTAYGKLKKLGEPVEPPEGLAQLLQSADLQARLDVLDAVAELPTDQALSLLYIASHDFASAVRRRAADVASALYKRTANRAFVNLLRVLLHDSDVLVRSGASELLLVLPKPTPAPPPDPFKPVNTVPVAVASDGQLRVLGDGSVRIQVDRGPPQAITSKPIPIAAGKHRISYVGGEQEINVTSGETAAITVPTTYAEQLLHDGIEAYQAKRLDRAQIFLERIKLLEQRGNVKRNLLPDVAYNLGRVYEDKHDLAKALQEYSRLRGMLGAQRRPDLRAALDKSIARLGPSIGHIVLSRRDPAGHCVVDNLYLPPGTHSIDLGLGKPEMVRTQAGVTTQINKCQK